MLAVAKAMVLFAPTPPSPDLPIEAGIEFLDAPDMMAASHYSVASDMLQAYVSSVSDVPKICGKCFV